MSTELPAPKTIKELEAALLQTIEEKALAYVKTRAAEKEHDEAVKKEADLDYWINELLRMIQNARIKEATE
jgi:hypothetical protein